MINIEHISLGALGDSFYEYLLKAWIQSGQTDTDARQMYDDAMDAIVNNIIQTSSGGLIYASDMKFERLEHKMDHLACFAGKLFNNFNYTKCVMFKTNVFFSYTTGGLFALGAATQHDQNSEKYMDIGKGITNTCHESYIRTATHLGPEAFRFDIMNVNDCKLTKNIIHSNINFFLDLMRVQKPRHSEAKRNITY